MKKVVLMISSIIIGLSYVTPSFKGESRQDLLINPELDSLCLVLPSTTIAYAILNQSLYPDSESADMDNLESDSFITDAGATLGRVLFYDKSLSFNDVVSCSSCHVQSLGFSDSERFSLGFEGTTFTSAHSMRLGNTRYYEPGEYFWDRRAKTLEDQVIKPIQDAIEMGFTSDVGGLDSLVSKLEDLSYYSNLFDDAFDDATITIERVQSALSQFIKSMVATNTRFDEGWAMVYDTTLNDRGLALDFPNFTEDENAGKELFVSAVDADGAGCIRCHIPPSFGLSGDSKSIGLSNDETTIFKSPSLINVAVTGPYMHDGSLETLDDVILHYATGINLSPSLDSLLILPDGTPERLQLNTNMRMQLATFLGTLTDHNLLSHERWSDPFYNCSSECETLVGTFEVIDSSQVLYHTRNIIKSHEEIINHSRAIYKSSEIELKEGFFIEKLSELTVENDPCID